ncbi:hypothetical protein FAM3257_00239 [Lacticaseibacillus paracasei]|nr:hypothetical protein FAM3257_00239 [Lacticaseibacillus paracasei]
MAELNKGKLQRPSPHLIRLLKLLRRTSRTVGYSIILLLKWEFPTNDYRL